MFSIPQAQCNVNNLLSFNVNGLGEEVKPNCIYFYKNIFPQNAMNTSGMEQTKVKLS